MKTIPSVLVRPLNLSTSHRRDIVQRASTIWRQLGRPVNRDVPIWLRAEREIIALDHTRRNTAAYRFNGASFFRSDRHVSATSM
jgi:hypothetical protein